MGRGNDLLESLVARVKTLIKPGTVMRRSVPEPIAVYLQHEKSILLQ